MIEIQEIPEIENRVWYEILGGNIDLQFEFLGLKVLLTRIKMAMKSTSSEQEAKFFAYEIRSLIKMNIHVHKVQKDLQKIIKAGS